MWFPIAFVSFMVVVTVVSFIHDVRHARPLPDWYKRDNQLRPGWYERFLEP